MRLKKAGNLTVTQFSVSEIPMDSSQQDIQYVSTEQRLEYDSPSPVRDSTPIREEIKEEIKEELKEEQEQELEMPMSPSPKIEERQEERMLELNADLAHPKTPIQRPSRSAKVGTGQQRGRAKYKGTIS